MNSGDGIDWATTVTAIGTAVLAIVTVVYVVLTHQILRAQTDPLIVVYAQNRPSLDMRGMIEIVIENIGNGVARDLRFTVSRPLRCDFLCNDRTGFMNIGPLIEGIPTLGPRQRRVVLWGHFNDVRDDVVEKSVIVRAFCKRANEQFALELEFESSLEVESLRHNELRFDDGTWECARHLQHIAELLKSRSDLL